MMIHTELTAIDNAGINVPGLDELRALDATLAATHHTPTPERRAFDTDLAAGKLSSSTVELRVAEVARAEAEAAAAQPVIDEARTVIARKMAGVLQRSHDNVVDQLRPAFDDMVEKVRAANITDATPDLIARERLADSDAAFMTILMARGATTRTVLEAQHILDIKHVRPSQVRHSYVYTHIEDAERRRDGVTLAGWIARLLLDGEVLHLNTDREALAVVATADQPAPRVQTAAEKAEQKAMERWVAGHERAAIPASPASPARAANK